MGEPTADLARLMLTRHRTLSSGACFVCVESTERDTNAFLFQGEPQRSLQLYLTAEPRDGSDIADPSLVRQVVNDSTLPSVYYTSPNPTLAPYSIRMV